MNVAVVRITQNTVQKNNRGEDMAKRVVIGLSGGVDSSVAALVLKNAGYDVVGVTMRLWDGEATDSCCSSSTEEDARLVAEKLGIEFHVLDGRKDFSEFVIDYFVDEYINGRTPNPCIACNRYLKFDLMVKCAEKLNADFVATGHYARIEYDEKTGQHILKKACNISKDQSYVLYNLSKDRLSKTLFPLGDFKDKDEVREYANAHNLVTANKPDSQEICFIPDNDYASFIKRRTGSLPPEGNFVDINGNVLGKHKGIVNYTVGQRKGLGIAFGKPMFVLKIDPKKNDVILGEQGQEFSDTLYAENVNILVQKAMPFRAEAKVRYSAKPANCTVSMEDDVLKVTFDEPQRAITPGQAVVIYDGDIVIGGGIIL